MAAKNSRDFHLRFLTDIDLDGIQNSVKSIERSLEKVDLNNSLQKKFTKIFDNIENEFSKVSDLATREFNNLGDISKLRKSTDNITTLFNSLDREITKLSDKKIKLFTQDEINQIQKVNNLIEEQKQKILKLASEQRELFDNLKNYDFSYTGSKGDISYFIKLIKEGRNYSNILEKIRENINQNDRAHGENADVIRQQTIEANRLEKKYNKANNTLDEHISRIEELKRLEASQKTEYDDNQKNLKNLQAKLKRREDKYINPETGEHYRGKLSDSTAAKWEEQAKEARELERQIKLVKEKVESYRSLRQERLELQKNLKNEESSVNQLRIEYEDASQAKKLLFDAQKDLDIKQLNNAVLKLEELEQNSKLSADEIDRLTKELLDIDISGANRAAEEFNDIDNNSRQAAVGVSKLDEEVQDLSAKGASMQNISDQFDDIYTRAVSFFSLENSIDIFKDSIRQAYESVKELDAAMTDIAVVTDFEVGDVWETIPEYTDLANDLGTTILGAYETAKLYYQQGLSNNEVMAASAETLKMARIAGMEYAEATDYMTAAVRGFKLEMQDAGRVNDVFSKLAAISASDTQEIADALTRTASIANSAGMSLETTSAFLTQMINFAIRTRVA